MGLQSFKENDDYEDQKSNYIKNLSAFIKQSMNLIHLNLSGCF